mmetsp:Transcript_5450/g.8960  ORF Transcript_5450/g.8960 Transcript_5450/m.8960 type:complete len:81 (-) Transcript_5450:91-333(-)
MASSQFLQLGLARLLWRNCFLMQTFRPSFINGVRISHNGEDQHYRGSKYADASKARPTRGQIRWYSATYDGCVDAGGRGI